MRRTAAGESEPDCRVGAASFFRPSPSAASFLIFCGPIAGASGWAGSVGRMDAGMVHRLPPPVYNFAVIPTVQSRRPLWDLKHPEDPDSNYE